MCIIGHDVPRWQQHLRLWPSVKRDDCVSAAVRGLQHKESYKTKIPSNNFMEIEYSICKTLHEVALRHSGRDVVENGEVGPQSVRPPGHAAWARDLPIDRLLHAIYASINRHNGPSWVISRTIGTGAQRRQRTPAGH